MFDTMTLTKSAGALCGSLLIFLLGSWAAELIYSSGGHGEDHAQGYVIDTGADEDEDDTAEEEPDLASLFAEADVSKGQRVFNQCSACHKLEDGENGVGPHLYGVVARDVGNVEDFDYSGALSEAADVWTAEELYAFLENPSDYAPGTSMGYSGLSKPEDRVNVIAYLDETDGEDNIEIASADSDGSDDGGSEDASENGSDDGNGEEGSDEGGEEASGEDSGDGSEEGSEDGSDEGSEESSEDGEGGEEASGEDSGDGSEEGSEDGSDEGSEESAEDGSDEGSDEASGDGASEFETMVASADTDAGEQLYRQCQACHQLETERNGVGPHLVDIVGREIASIDDFRYSDALADLDGAWTLDELSAWIEDPSDYAPGNKMGYRGLADEQDRADLMAYLQSVQD
ncbi:MAG: cytochrome c family protein [Roseovarius sp.]